MIRKKIQKKTGLRKVHLVAICGTGMGSLAGLLRADGIEVTGSDLNAYPPMSDQLEALGIRIRKGYRPEHLDADTDLVVIGNAVRKDNPEALEAEQRGLTRASLPQALAELYLVGRHSVVAAGTHGKTTTSAMLASILESAGREPGFLVGGVPIDFGATSRPGSGEIFVVEGDEYDSAFFDKRPKFLHYRPRSALLTSIEFDHADIYDSMEDLRTAFVDFCALIPTDGVLAACIDDPEVRRLLARPEGEGGGAEVRRPGCRVETYGASEDAAWQLVSFEGRTGFDKGVGGGMVTVDHGGEEIRLETPLPGRHNALNAVGALALLTSIGLSIDEVREGLVRFQGVKRRQELVGRAGGIAVIDDFAHHPSAVRETIGAIRAAMSAGKLYAVFEPRTNTSRRNLFQEQYAQAFDECNVAVISDVYARQGIADSDRLCPHRLVEEIKERGREACFLESAGKIIDFLAAELVEGDAALVMSSGSFDGLPGRLIEALGRKSPHGVR